MDKNAIKKYAVWARRELISRVSQRALQYGVSEKESIDADAESVHGHLLSDAEKRQRKALIARVKKMGYEQTMEEAAYTWFNRFIALRFMEVNGYLPTHIRVFTDDENCFKPQIIAEAIHLDPDTMLGLDMEKVYAYKDKNQTDELFKYLIVTQCNALIAILPGMFTRIDDYTELLFPDNLLREGSAVEQMVTTIPEDDWKDAVQIIGWLYQYYNTEPKDKVFADLKKNIKISKENIPAATQLFTPDWIVRYMVENSLGRLWLEHLKAERESGTLFIPAKGVPAHQNADGSITLEAGGEGGIDGAYKKNWKYYLDEAEQEPEVEAQLKEIRKSYRDIKPENIRCIDPCMGSGHILAYMFDVLVQIYESCGYTTRDAIRSIVENNIYGLDIDDRAAQLAYFAVMMKARQYDRRFFTRGIQPHVSAIVESQPISDMSFFDLCGNEKLVALKIYESFKDAKEYGSILQPEVTLAELDALQKRLDEVFEMSSYGDLFAQQRCDTITNTMYPLVEQARALVQKYDVVVTNPPYMGTSNAGARVQEYIKKTFPDSKADFFAVFIERCGQMTRQNGYQAMITQHAWMFLSSFEKLRGKLLQKDTVNMAHLGARAFEEIGGEVVQTTSFVLRNSHITDCKGVYCRLVEPTTQKGKEDMFLAGENRFASAQDNFKTIPGLPVAYWVSNAILNAYANGMAFSGDTKKGILTGNDAAFVRYWFEVSKEKIGFTCYSHSDMLASHCKWFPKTGGGTWRKWYGNLEDVVNLENDGALIKATVQNYRLRDSAYYMREAVSWTEVAGGHFSCRYVPQGVLFGNGGPVCFFGNELKSVLGLLNSKVAIVFLQAIAPTMNFGPEQIRRIPLVNWKYDTADAIVSTNITISKMDWDAFETSWDFQRHPLVEYRHSVSKANAPDNWYLKSAYEAWEYQCKLRFDTLKTNEEELNRIFIDIYGLQDELTPEVEDKDVTVRLADKKRDIRSLISYAVGCMFGRYSLDEPGLILAGYDRVEHTTKTYDGDDPELEKFAAVNADGSKSYGSSYRWVNQERHKSFLIDVDNVIPICDDEYFDDDIVARFVRFIEVVYGKETLDENLRFIADALGGSGQPRDVIRNYFLNDFYADHLKIYQKRPIYWLFDSGKKGGFKALIYMHRYQPDTIARIRTDYVFEQQARYRTAIADLEQRMTTASTSERVKLTKQLQKLQAQDAEIRAYEEKVHHLADQMIPIDLDDGVKHNYEIFRDVLAPIK